MGLGTQDRVATSDSTDNENTKNNIEFSTYEDVWTNSDDKYKARFGGDKAKGMQAMKAWNEKKYGTTGPTAEAAKRGVSKEKLGEQHGEVKKFITEDTKKSSAELNLENNIYKNKVASGEITTLGNLGTKPNIDLSLSGATNTRQNASSANVFSKLSNNNSVVGNFGNKSKIGASSLGVDISAKGLMADASKNITSAETKTNSKTKDFSDAVYDTTSNGIKNRFGGGISKFLQKRQERKNSTAGPNENANSAKKLANTVQDRKNSILAAAAKEELKDAQYNPQWRAGIHGASQGGVLGDASGVSSRQRQGNVSRSATISDKNVSNTLNIMQGNWANVSANKQNEVFGVQGFGKEVKKSRYNTEDKGENLSGLGSAGWEYSNKVTNPYKKT